MKTLTLALLTLVAAPALGETSPEMGAQKIRDNLWLLTGPGGNIALSVGPDAAFIVDDQVQPMSAALKAQIAKITDKPVKFVINTHWHGDHTGGNLAMSEAGAVILAHDNVRQRMSREQFLSSVQKKSPPAPPMALPVVTFADGVTLHLNGDDVEVLHVAPAHTDGDSIVHFHKADVIHTGDCYVSAGYPFIDRGSGGHVDGFFAAADRVLGIAGPKTRIIPGHGPVTDRAGLTLWRDNLRTIRDRIAAAIAAKKTLAEVKAAHPSAEFDAKWKNDFITPDKLVEAIYEDLSAAKK